MQAAAKILFLKLVVFTLICASCIQKEPQSTISSRGNRIGQFKGYVTINQTIQSRFFEPGPQSNKFFLGRYFDEEITNADGLFNLLGGFSGDGLTNGFRNGSPNALNMLLWNIVASGIARDVASSCGAENNPLLLSGVFPYNQRFAESLRKICQWPSADASTPDALENLWLSIMGYDAPPSEFEAWRDFFLAPDSPYRSSSSTVAMSAMIRSALLNPYFLLEH